MPLAPWIEQERFGFTCDYSEASLSAMLAWLRDHPEERLGRGVRARELFETRFNRRVMDELVGKAALRAAVLTDPIVEAIEPASCAAVVRHYRCVQSRQLAD